MGPISCTAGGRLICSDILTSWRHGAVERVASLVARQFLAAAAAFGILVLAACGTLSPQDLTAIAELEPSPTPVADVVAMFGGSPSGDGVFDARGPTFAPDEAWRFPAADITSPPVVSGGLVLIGVADGASESGFYLTAFDARAQRELWRFATGRQVYSAPAVSDGVVYVSSTGQPPLRPGRRNRRGAVEVPGRGRIVGLPGCLGRDRLLHRVGWPSLRAGCDDRRRALEIRAVWPEAA